MGEHPARARRRVVPDTAQTPLIRGSLRGDARIVGAPGARRLHVSERADRAGYVWWKYERLAAIADEPPHANGERVEFTTIAHPLFDDLADLVGGTAERLDQLLEPLGRAVLRTDIQAGERRGLAEAGPSNEIEVIRE